MTVDLSSCPTLAVFVQAYLRQFPDCKLFDMDHESLEKITAEVGKVITALEADRDEVTGLIVKAEKALCNHVPYDGSLEGSFLKHDVVEDLNAYLARHGEGKDSKPA